MNFSRRNTKYKLRHTFFTQFWTVLVLSGLVVGQLALPSTAEAGATLSFSPSSKTLSIGESWSVKVMVNATQQINSGTVKVTYTATKLKATTIGCGTDFSTPIAPSIANGVATISCARFSPFSGSGHFATVTFQALASGSATLGFGVSTIVANDGMGTNVYTGGGSGSVTIAAPSTAAPPTNNPPSSGGSAPAPTPVPTQAPPTSTASPSISSTSHADQERWYKERKVAISWSNTGTEFNYAIDQNAGTQLAQTARDAATTFSETVSGDGVWYAHVRANGDKGWSNTSHFKLQIDNSAPTTPSISTEPASPMKVLPTITFSAEDSISGIEYYEIKLDDGEWQKAGSPYKPTQITSGEHTISVRAVDRAGNKAEAQSKFTIVPLAKPTIDSLPEGILMLGQTFKVSGSAPANTTVEIYINGEKKESVTADKDGKFSSKEAYVLFPGSYKITAKAINADGISSPDSDTQTVTIDARAVSVMGLILPGWGVFGIGGFLLVALLLGLLWLAYRLWTQSRSWAGQLGVVGERLDKEVFEMQGDLVAIVNSSLGGVNPQAASAIKDEIEKQIEELGQEVDDELKQAGAMNFAVTAKDQSGWWKKVPTWVSAIPGIVALKGNSLLSVIKKSTKKKDNESHAEDNSRSNQTQAETENQKPDTDLSSEAVKALTELEKKAEASTQKSDTSSKLDDIIPEIGDILAPEKD